MLQWDQFIFCVSCWHPLCFFSPSSSLCLFFHQVHQFSNKQTEMALRVASLDYLGTVAARLRKDAVTSKMDQRSIDRILQQVEEKLHIWFFMVTEMDEMVQAENVCYSWVFLLNMDWFELHILWSLSLSLSLSGHIVSRKRWYPAAAEGSTGLLGG